MNKNRQKFRDEVFSRDNNNCIVPWCNRNADDAHHIIERKLWENGGYIPENGASVCNHHHRYAEENHIPPQAFYMWAGIGIDEIKLPKRIRTKDINKWGDEFETPPWKEHRNRIKYQSSRHLLPLYWNDEKTVAKKRIEDDDTELESIDDFVGVPLVITHKMDGSNCMIVNDVDNPVRARNGSSPIETMKKLYGEGGLYWQQKVNQKLPNRLQVFGEWVYAKHSIHYGCNCKQTCEDIGPSLSELTGINDDRAYFQIFGVYDKIFDIWLSWPETKKVAKTLGFPTTPIIYCENDKDEATFDKPSEAINTLIKYARDVINNGGEGIVVRSKYPYHYGQFSRRLGKYVRENHVKTDKHWSKNRIIENKI